MKQHFIFSFLLFSLFINMVLSQTCPNSCSGHGTCNRGTCLCFSGYVGTDCSIYEREIQNGVWLEGSVDLWQFHYFKFFAGIGTGNIQFELVSKDANSTGDCDLYVKYNERPTRFSYDYKDSNPNIDSKILVENVYAGYYYAGVYAFYSCSYKIRVSVLGECTNPCVNGVCRHGFCVCNPGYSGPTCSDRDSVLELNKEVRDRVEKNEWKYYNLTLSATYSAVDVVLHQVGGGAEADCDLYARYGELPSQFEWDYFDQNFRENVSKVSLVEPERGTWYIGVYGYQHECSYTIKATPVTGCLNSCTRRGACQSLGVCNCNAGYNGTYCEEKKDSLQNGEQVTGYVEFLTWNYYKVNTDSQNSLIVFVNQRNATSDCDIYIKFNGWPSVTNFDYYDVTVEQNFNLTINDAGVGTWYLGIYGVSHLPCVYDLNVRLSSQCPGCIHGECLEGGYCYCNEGWAGTNCNTRIQPISDQGVLPDTIERGVFKYFNFTTKSSTIYIGLKEKSTVGMVWLFASRDYAPDLRYHDFSDVDTKKSFHSIEIKYDQPWDEGAYKTIIIAVYGSPFASRPVDFELVAWGTPF